MELRGIQYMYMQLYACTDGGTAPEVTHAFATAMVIAVCENSGIEMFVNGFCIRTYSVLCLCMAVMAARAGFRGSVPLHVPGLDLVHVDLGVFKRV